MGASCLEAIGSSREHERLRPCAAATWLRTTRRASVDHCHLALQRMRSRTRVTGSMKLRERHTNVPGDANTRRSIDVSVIPISRSVVWRVAAPLLFQGSPPDRRASPTLSAIANRKMTQLRQTGSRLPTIFGMDCSKRHARRPRLASMRRRIKYLLSPSNHSRICVLAFLVVSGTRRDSRVVRTCQSRKHQRLLVLIAAA